MMAPIPIAMCGKVSPHAQAFAQLMLPDYEIIHRFSSVSDFLSSITPLMSGEPNIGTIPVAIFVGGGFSPEELAEMMATPEAKTVVWVTPGTEGREEVRAKGDLMSKEQREQGPGKGMMEIVVGRVKECLRSHGVKEGEEGWKGKGGELWRC